MRKVPIHLAKGLGNNTAKYRWFALLYLFTAFFLLPAIVFGLSLAGYKIFLSIAIPVFFVFDVIVVINIFQAKQPNLLPEILRDWTFLPEPMRSLRPYDKPIASCGNWCAKCSWCDCCASSTKAADTDSEDVELAVTASDVKTSKCEVSTIS